MRRSGLAGCAVLFVLGCGGSTQDSTAGSAASEEARVLAAEDAYVAAEIDADEAALRRLVDDRFVMNSADGTTPGKEELIGMVLGMDMTGQTISDRSVTIDGDMGVVFGTTELHLRSADGTEQTAAYRYTSVFVKRNDEWRLFALQMDRLAAGE